MVGKSHAWWLNFTPAQIFLGGVVADILVKRLYFWGSGEYKYVW
jgi:hypothetical protein